MDCCEFGYANALFFFFFFGLFYQFLFLLLNVGKYCGADYSTTLKIIMYVTNAFNSWNR